MRRFLFTVAVLATSAAGALAQAGKSIEYKGLEVQQTLQTGTGYRISTVFLEFSNPNAKAVEVRNIRCEFHDGDKLVKQFSIPRLLVGSGMDKYEAPVKVEGAFNRALCKIGK